MKCQMEIEEAQESGRYPGFPIREPVREYGRVRDNGRIGKSG